MGSATDYTELLEREPLSRAEIATRRAAAQVRENVTTSLDGNVVERVTPKAAPLPVHRPERATWD
jgi:hypothetical protein